MTLVGRERTHPNIVELGAAASRFLALPVARSPGVLQSSQKEWWFLFMFIPASILLLVGWGALCSKAAYRQQASNNKNEAREIRTPNLLIWSQTRCRCAIAPLENKCTSIPKAFRHLRCGIPICPHGSIFPGRLRRLRPNRRGCGRLGCVCDQHPVACSRI